MQRIFVTALVLFHFAIIPSRAAGQQAVSLAAMNTAVLATGSDEVRTEAAADEKVFLVSSTAELVARVGELRTELELLRQDLLRTKGGQAAACLRCRVKEEWRSMPIGLLAPFRVEKALCGEAGAEGKSAECFAAAEFHARVREALSRSLSSLEQISCTYLTKQLGTSEQCPTAIGSFYDCSASC